MFKNPPFSLTVMRVIGFNFDKISIEKLKERPENIKINTNIDISDIKEVKTDLLKTKDQLVNVKFAYTVKYEPGFAVVDLKGTIILALEEKLSKEVFKEWKKKKMPHGFQTTLFNIILRRATVKSLQLEDEMNLPLHMPLPTLKIGNEK